MTIDSSFEHPSKALYSIDTTFVGMMIFVRPLTGGDDKQEWSRTIRIQLGMRVKKPQVVLLTSKSMAKRGGNDDCF